MNSVQLFFYLRSKVADPKLRNTLGLKTLNEILFDSKDSDTNKVLMETLNTNTGFDFNMG